MAYSKEQIIADVKDYIQKKGDEYRAWYCGISNDPRSRLFSDHNVTEEGGRWIFRKASSDEVAREVESHFVNVCGTDGGRGGGDYTSTCVYAYKKTPSTNP